MHHITLEGVRFPQRAVIEVLKNIRSSVIKSITIGLVSIYGTTEVLPELSGIFSGGNPDLSVPRIKVRFTLPAIKSVMDEMPAFKRTAEQTFRDKGIENRLEW